MIQNRPRIQTFPLPLFLHKISHAMLSSTVTGKKSNSRRRRLFSRLMAPVGLLCFMISPVATCAWVMRPNVADSAMPTELILSISRVCPCTGRRRTDRTIHSMSLESDTDLRGQPLSNSSDRSSLGGRLSLPTPPPVSSTTSITIPTAFGIIAASVVSVLFIDDITAKYEIVQAWRYSWPLIGTAYMVSGLSSIISSDSSDKKDYDLFYDASQSINSIVPMIRNRWVGTVSAVFGSGLLIGGCIDAFFPVWYTSPDLLGTRAGIEADSAAILLILTVGSFMKNYQKFTTIKRDRNEGKFSPLWLPVVIVIVQLWEIASPTFYSFGEILSVLS